MTVKARSLHRYQVEIEAGTHTLVSDEPVGVGDDAGPSPFDLLLGGLASCTIITLHMYAGRKKWPLERVEMTLDIVPGEAPTGSVHRSSIIKTELTFHGPLTMEQMKRLEEIANRCPVHKTLTGEIRILSEATNLRLAG